MWRVRVVIVPLYTQHCVLCVLLSYVSLCQLYKNIECCSAVLLWLIYVASNNNTYVGLKVKCTMLH